jgi:rod shape-determining protein MreD
MVQDSLRTLIWFISLIILQVLVFDNINLFGFSCPALYLLFIICYRFDGSQFNLILLGFLLGLFIDLFQQSSGANTIASLFISFIRPIIIRFSFDSTPDSSSILSMKSRQDNKIVFICMMVLIHQLILQITAYFDVEHSVLIIRNSLVNSLLTFTLIFTALPLIKKKN